MGWLVAKTSLPSLLFVCFFRLVCFGAMPSGAESLLLPLCSKALLAKLKGPNMGLGINWGGCMQGEI